LGESALTGEAMAWAWGDVIDESFDWTDVATLNIFDKAVYERAWAAQSGFQPYGSVMVPPPGWLQLPNPTPTSYAAAWSVGDDVQVVNKTSTSSLPTYPYDGSSIAGWQQQIEATTTLNWVDPAINIAGYNPNTTTASAVISANTIDVDSILRSFGYTDTETIPPIFPFGDVSWHRECPRTVEISTYILDVESNTIDVGMIAYIKDLGYVGQFDGTNWIPQPPGTRPDTLTSDSAQPDYCIAGIMRNGDYIGHWLFKQMMQVMQKMSVRGAVGSGRVEYTQGTSPYTRSTVSLAAAKSTDITAWNASLATSPNYAGIGGGGIGEGLVKSFLVDENFGDHYWVASHEVFGITYEFGTFISTASKSIEMWAGLIALNGSGLGEPAGSTYTGTFNNCGQGGTVNTYYNFYSGAANTTATIEIPCWPDVTIQPSWPADPTTPTSGTAATNYMGFLITGTIGLVKWSFTYP
jgi:hypothetical protein